MTATIDTDYLVIGSGAVGLAFADTLLNESDATITIVDRHEKPGGHWNDAYAFVQLHQPSAFYGVNSVQLGRGQKDVAGLNKGYHELASGAEVSQYFDQLVHQHFLPSGRVQYYPKSDYLGQGRFVSLGSGAETQVKVNRKTVDATFYGTTVPSTHTRNFEVAAGVACVPPNALPDVWQSQARKPNRFVILGAGKTAMDVGVWLLESGADPDAIAWVTPRDSWLLNRHHTQPGHEFFHETIGCQAALMVALAEAKSPEDLFARLEACGMMLRIHPDIAPSMYHCATLSIGEVERLRQIKNVIRKGRVKALEPTRMILDHGVVDVAPSTLFIDCTASAIERREPVPIFQGDLITPQMIRICQPTFSSALAAHVELAFDDDARKNQFCGVVPIPDGMLEFLSITLTGMLNQFQWSREKGIRQWLLDSRLDGFSEIIAGIDRDDQDKQAVMAQLRAFAGPAIENTQKLMAQHCGRSDKSVVNLVNGR